MLIDYFQSKGLKSASVGSVVIKFVTAAIALLNGILLTNHLSVAGFGYYVLAFSTIIILTVPATLGFPNLIIRYFSKYIVLEDFASIKGLIIKTTQIVFISILVIYFVGALSYWFWWYSFNNVFRETLLYSFLMLPLISFTTIFSAGLRGLKLIISADFSDILLRNLMLLSFILVYVLVGKQLTPQKAILFQVVASLISCLTSFLFLRKELYLIFKDINPKYNNSEWISQAIPFTLNSGIQVLKVKSLSFVLAVFGSVESVAIFDVALRGAKLVSFTLDALSKAIAPFISSTFEKNKIDAVQDIIKNTSRIIFLFSLPVAAIFIFGGQNLLLFIFGENYGVSYVPLVILCAGEVISAVIGPVGVLLNMTGRQVLFAKSNFVALIMNVLIGIFLVHYFDSLGAATAYAISVLVHNFYLLFCVRRDIGISTTIF